MKFNIDDVLYDVLIIKKNNKNLYIRVKEDFVIYVTCNKKTKNKEIFSVLENNVDAIKKMIEKIKCKKIYDSKFYYLGKEYNLVIFPNANGNIRNNNIYFSDLNKIEKWYLKNAKILFEDRFSLLKDIFKEDIPKSTLKIRKMKSRWGVCNRKNNTVTLNLELVKRDISCLDYVIIHELCHFVYFDHSKKFWNLVSKYCPNYKKIRKEMKVY